MIVAAVVIVLIVSSINSYTNKFQALVGERVVVGKDTLIIVNSSVLNEDYTLANGTKVSWDYAKKHIVK